MWVFFFRFLCPSNTVVDRVVLFFVFASMLHEGAGDIAREVLDRGTDPTKERVNAEIYCLWGRLVTFFFFFAGISNLPTHLA